jgi:hypothetical protein
MRNYKVIFLAALIMPAVILTAQETANTASSDGDLFFGSDEISADGDLFGDGDMVSETPTETRKAFSLSDINIFSTDTVRIGGSLASSLETLVQWKENGKTYQYDSAALLPDFRGAFFIDARPLTTLRIYSKFNYAFPFQMSIPLGAPGSASHPLVISQFNVFELFTDFSWNEAVFFRFGKHTIKWGAGYFFSPVDVLNLSVIDPEEPETQREGPVSLRAQFIFPDTQNVLYTYILPDTNTFHVEDTAAAAKFEFPVGNTELRFGGWYKHLRSPRFTMTYSGTIFRKVGVFGEGLFAWGKDSEWLANKAAGDMKPVFQATAGLSYMNTDAHLSLIGQYFYNGFGEKNSSAGLSTSALINLSGYSGRHYAAASIGLSELFTSRLSVALFGMFGIDSRCGITNFLIAWRFFDELILSVGPTFAYGNDYTRDGKPVVGLQITAKLGGGNF